MTDLDAFLAEVGRSQLGWPESLRFTYDATRRLLSDGVPGDLVECGVGAGCHPAVMAKACIDTLNMQPGDACPRCGKETRLWQVDPADAVIMRRPCCDGCGWVWNAAGVAVGGGAYQRTIRLFDSFQGLPHGGPKDAEWNASWGDGSGRLEPSGVAACSAEDVAANLLRWVPEYRDNFVLHKGWFQDIVPAYAEMVVGHANLSQPIAFLRLDGDLYASTKVCLEHLWDLCSPGAILCVDDLNLDGCWQACSEFLGSREMSRFQSITESGDAWLTKT